MLFVTGPLYSGKRTFAQQFSGRRIADVQALAAKSENLAKLADELTANYDIILATAGRLACLLAARADCVVQLFCGIPTVLKGELPKC